MEGFEVGLVIPSTRLVVSYRVRVDRERSLEESQTLYDFERRHVGDTRSLGVTPWLKRSGYFRVSRIIVSMWSTSILQPIQALDPSSTLSSRTYSDIISFMNFIRSGIRTNIETTLETSFGRPNRCTGMLPAIARPGSVAIMLCRLQSSSHVLTYMSANISPTT